MTFSRLPTASPFSSTARAAIGRRGAVALGLALLFAATGCTSTYYSVMEQIGRDKRDILRSRIDEGREDQEEAQEQIKTTYERLKEMADYDGGDLESLYSRLDADYQDSVEHAEEVSEQIESIDEVANDLWVEWASEIELISSARLREQSRTMLNDTKRRYERVISAMRQAESKMPPVLDAFRDQVLFLKHNLNARAIAALEGTVGRIERDVERLIRDIDVSIREAEQFLQELDRS